LSGRETPKKKKCARQERPGKKLENRKKVPEGHDLVEKHMLLGRFPKGRNAQREKENNSGKKRGRPLGKKKSNGGG